MKILHFTTLFLLVLLIACHQRSSENTTTEEATEIASVVKIACIGNSITYGSGIENREQNAYPAKLDSLLGEGYEVRNFGVSGRTLLKKGDYPYWEEEAFAEAQAYQPDIVVIKLGTNDTKPQNWAYADEFVPNYVELVQTFQNLESNPTVFIARPVPAFEVNFDIDGAIITNEVLPKIDSIAQQTGAAQINLYDPFLDKATMFPDAIHPNAEGAGEMAKLVAAEVRALTE